MYFTKPSNLLVHFAQRPLNDVLNRRIIATLHDGWFTFTYLTRGLPAGLSIDACGRSAHWFEDHWATHLGKLGAPTSFPFEAIPPKLNRPFSHQDLALSAVVAPAIQIVSIEFFYVDSARALRMRRLVN
jgi:hypothetical protein